MERAEGLLGGKCLLKNDGTIDKTKVVCSICQAEIDFSRKVTRPVREKVTNAVEKLKE